MRCQHWAVVYAGNGGDIRGKRMGHPVSEPAGIVKRGTADVEVVKQRIGNDHLRQDKAHRREQGSLIAKARMPLSRLLEISHRQNQDLQDYRMVRACTGMILSSDKIKDKIINQRHKASADDADEHR